jgi:hypothetical protein
MVTMGRRQLLHEIDISRDNLKELRDSYKSQRSLRGITRGSLVVAGITGIYSAARLLFDVDLSEFFKNPYFSFNGVMNDTLLVSTIVGAIGSIRNYDKENEIKSEKINLDGLMADLARDEYLENSNYRNRKYP